MAKIAVYENAACSLKSYNSFMTDSKSMKKYFGTPEFRHMLWYFTKHQCNENSWCQWMWCRTRRRSEKENKTLKDNDNILFDTSKL